MVLKRVAVLLLGLVLAVMCPSTFGQEKRDTVKADPGKTDSRKTDMNKDAGKGKLSSGDANKLEAIARADMAEVAAGKLGASKAQSAEVKKFARHMVDEHSKMLDEGGKLAKSKGVTPPSGPDKKHEAALKKLEGLSGDQFDRAFMSQMVNDHREALKLVKETASKADDADLRAMAQKATPKVEEHLKMAQSIEGKSKGKSEAKATGGEIAHRDMPKSPPAGQK